MEESLFFFFFFHYRATVRLSKWCTLSPVFRRFRNTEKKNEKECLTFWLNWASNPGKCYVVYYMTSIIGPWNLKWLSIFFFLSMKTGKKVFLDLSSSLNFALSKLTAAALLSHFNELPLDLLQNVLFSYFFSNQMPLLVLLFLLVYSYLFVLQNVEI